MAAPPSEAKIGRAPTIRPARRDDAEAMREIYNDAVQTTTATFDTEPRSESEQLEWLERHDAQHPVLVAELDHRVLGWVSLSPWSERRAYTRTAEVSVYVGAEWRNRGIGRALLAQILADAQRVGLHTILARVAEGNPQSRELHVRTGFTTVGVMHEVGHKFGRLLDVELLEFRLESSSQGQ
ncbi:MAG: N-acetyltransferase family protein [Thermoplasmata archaeon]